MFHVVQRGGEVGVPRNEDAGVPQSVVLRVATHQVNELLVCCILLTFSDVHYCDLNKIQHKILHNETIIPVLSS